MSNYSFTPSKYQEPILLHVENNLDVVKQYFSPSKKWVDAPLDLELPNLTVTASAGSGKTTLIAECFRQAYLRNVPFHMITCLSFVRKNVDDIKSKFKEMVEPEDRKDAEKCVKTFNGLGYALTVASFQKWNELHPERPCDIHDIHVEKKYAWIIDAKFNEQQWNEALCSKSSMGKIVDKLREQIILYPTVDKLQDLVERFGIRHGCQFDYEWEAIVDMAKAVLYDGIKKANPYYNHKPIVDYGDQCLIPFVMAKSTNPNQDLYLHYQQAIEEWKQQNAIIFADEVQDINPVLLSMLKQLSSGHSTTMLVGDPGQNIYAWRGSKADGMDNISKDVGAIIYNLPISYRLPKGHVDVIKSIWPNRPIEHFHKDKGNVYFITKENPHWLDELDKVVKLPEQKLFIARKNANAFKLAIALLGRGHLIKIKELATQAKKYAKQCLGYYKKGDQLNFPSDPENVLLMIENWSEYTIKSLRRKGSTDEDVQSILDWRDALMVTFMGIMGGESAVKYPKSWEEWEANIDRLNSRKRAAKYNVISINTIHAAKGAEAPIVVLIDPDDCPLQWNNQSNEDYEQEMNALFVALSRAKITNEPNSGTMVFLCENDLNNMSDWMSIIQDDVRAGKVNTLALPANEFDLVAV